MKHITTLEGPDSAGHWAWRCVDMDCGEDASGYEPQEVSAEAETHGPIAADSPIPPIPAKYTAWVTTDRSCLDSDFCDVVVLANDADGNSTGDPILSAVTTVRFDVIENARDDELMRQARDLLSAAGWEPREAWDYMPTGFVINVDPA